MLIDSNLVLIDGPATSTGSGCAVPLNAFSIPGRQEPVPIVLRVVEAFDNCTSLTFKLQQADTENGVYADVPGSAQTVPLADLVPGTRLGWKYLPRNVEKPWIKVHVTVTGAAPTKGGLFAAVTREIDEPYEKGLYVDKGIVVG